MLQLLNPTGYTDAVENSATIVQYVAGVDILCGVSTVSLFTVYFDILCGVSTKLFYVLRFISSQCCCAYLFLG